MQKIRYKGATLIMVVSVILIILGALNLLGGVSAAFLGRITASTLGLDEFGQSYYQVMGFVSLISGVVGLAGGIFGVRFNNHGDKAGLLLVVGIIQLIVVFFVTLYGTLTAAAGERVTQQIMDNVGVSLESDGINTLMSMGGNVMTVVTFLLPALFIVGALLNKKPPKIPQGYSLPEERPVE